MYICIYVCMYVGVCMYICIYGKWVYLVQVSSIYDFWNMNNDPNALATEYKWRMWTINLL